MDKNEYEAFRAINIGETLAALDHALTEARIEYGNTHMGLDAGIEASKLGVSIEFWKTPLFQALDAERAKLRKELVAIFSEKPEPLMSQKTERDYLYTEIPFRDYHGTPERHLSIQDSSVANERKLWVGFDTVHVDLQGNGGKHIMTRGHLDEDTVRTLRDTLTEWLEN